MAPRRCDGIKLIKEQDAGRRRRSAPKQLPHGRLALPDVFVKQLWALDGNETQPRGSCCRRNYMGLATTCDVADGMAAEAQCPYENTCEEESCGCLAGQD